MGLSYEKNAAKFVAVRVKKMRLLFVLRPAKSSVPLSKYFKQSAGRLFVPTWNKQCGCEIAISLNGYWDFTFFELNAWAR